MHPANSFFTKTSFTPSRSNAKATAAAARRRREARSDSSLEQAFGLRRRERRVATTVSSRLRGLRFLPNNAKDRLGLRYDLRKRKLEPLAPRLCKTSAARLGKTSPSRLRDPLNMKGRNLPEIPAARLGGCEYSPRLPRLFCVLASGQSSKPSGSLRLPFGFLGFTSGSSKRPHSDKKNPPRFLSRNNIVL